MVGRLRDGLPGNDNEQFMDMQGVIYGQTRSTAPIREYYVVEPTLVAPGSILPRYAPGTNNLERYLIGDGRILIQPGAYQAKTAVFFSPDHYKTFIPL